MNNEPGKPKTVFQRSKQKRNTVQTPQFKYFSFWEWSRALDQWQGFVSLDWHSKNYETALTSNALSPLVTDSMRRLRFRVKVESGLRDEFKLRGYSFS